MKFLKNYFNLFFFILNMLFLSLTYSESSNWLIRMDSVEISNNDFNSSFLNYLDFEYFTNSMLQKDMEKVSDDKIRSAYLQNYINNLIILNEVKKKKLFNMKEIDQKVVDFSKILKDIIIKKMFITNIIKPSIKKIDPYIIESFYSKLSKDPNFNNLPIKEKKRISEEKAFMKQVEVEFTKTLNTLRGKNIIKLNDEFY